MAENQNSGDWLQPLVTVVLLVFVGYQIYSGVALKKIGVPGIFEIEFAEKSSEPPQKDPNPVSEPKPEPEPEPELTSINLAYMGDYYGCNLPLSITIGRQRLLPQGSFFSVDGVELGNQNYEIAGSIHCPTIGSCKVSGEGFINVQPGRTYNIYWQNTDYGVCDAVLQ